MRQLAAAASASLAALIVVVLSGCPSDGPSEAAAALSAAEAPQAQSQDEREDKHGGTNAKGQAENERGEPVAAPRATPSKAGQSAKEKAKKKEETAGRAGESEEAPRVYTNEDLERLFGPAPPPKPKAGETSARKETGTAAQVPAPEDALKRLQEEQARERTRERLLAEARKKVEELEARVRRLQDRLLRLHNPFLPRPELDMTEEELEAWKGLDNVARVELTEKQLEEARRELAQARKALQALEQGASPE